MHSASRLTCADFSSSPATCLLTVLNELLRAVDGRVALLRPVTGGFDSHRDDIDLLLTETQRQQLLRATYAHCMSGQIHCRIQKYSPAKAQLVLWTINCTHKLMIDLWTSFDQLPRRRHSCIPAERLLSTLTASLPDAQIHANEKIPALRRLPPDIDFCLLIQHFAAKRRRVATPAVRERIALACERLASWSPELISQHVPHDPLVALRAVADQLRRAAIITPQIVASSDEYLVQRLWHVPGNRGLPVLETRRCRGRMTELRKTILKHRPTLAVIGSDGAGKSSVVSALALQQPNSTSVVAKKFYRRSLTYQFISGLVKRFRGTDRGRFDDSTAPLITLRAAVALWIDMCFPYHVRSKTRPSVAAEDSLVTAHKLRTETEISGARFHRAGHVINVPHVLNTTVISAPVLNKSAHTTILDRSIDSFLIIDRKSDTPHLTRFATWIERLIPPATRVLLTLPHADLTGRKQEMSAPGHDIYQRLLFEQALRQQPADLILLANLPSAQAAAAAICELLQDDRQSVASSTTADNSKAAA